jgi:predicted RNase H-like HicB family nuclease
MNRYNSTDLHKHMKRILYPAVFRPTKTGYSVDFPDLSGCVSAGANLDEALGMAQEALSLHLYGMQEDGDAIPAPGKPAGIRVSLVETRPGLVRDELENRAVKKTLTLPKWLNDEAERRGINFSQVLQAAIRARIGV